MHRISFVAAMGLAASVTALALPAQSIDEHAVQFGVMGGATRPVGDVAYVAHLDWNVGALLTIGSPSARLKFRVDGQWQQLAGTQPLTGSLLSPCLGCSTPGQPVAQNFRVLDLTTDAVYAFTPGNAKSFYLIGGIGAYNARQMDPRSGDDTSITRFGFNAGAGLKFKLGRVSPFVEARYHDIVGGHTFQGAQFPAANSFQFIPINVGILF